MAAGEVRTRSQTRLVLRAVAAIRLPPRAVDLEAVDIVLELELTTPASASEP